MNPIIAWFRNDMRLGDNPALSFAAASGKPLICLYIRDDETPGLWKAGGASRWWLHHSLAALDRSLKKKDGKLVLCTGRAEKLIAAIVRQTGADAIVWNRCYEPYAVARDTVLKKSLTEDGIAVESFNGALLFEPWEVKAGNGNPYRVFTPFWNAAKDRLEPGKPHPAPHAMTFHDGVKSEALKDWNLLPTKPDWAKGIAAHWQPGEETAQETLSDFLDHIQDYKKGRDIPGRDDTSSLSPHLAFGEISPRQIWHAVRAHPHARSDGAETFLKELGWREFCHQLLFHNPDLPEQPFDKRFEHFEWTRSPKNFHAWTKGMTGIPIVDAGMRQLWQTGWMHNRVRMIAASFLIKHLGIDWREGQDWFWDTLVDADLANNAANWQWVAGSGADAAPFFRIFNPVLQGEKFDPDGAYVRRFVPELADVPDKYVHKPWTMPKPPPNYPAPLVDLALGRERALKAFKALPKSKT
jgi:deoxyribodipyrimidine photo-lyase